MIRAWLRRWLGPSRRELRELAETWERRCAVAQGQTREAHVALREARVRGGEQKHRAEVAEARLRSAQQRLELAAEPVQRPGCGKVRLHRRAEADEWREQIEQRTGKADGLAVYSCKVCPRSPVTMKRYFHVGHPHGAEEAKQASKAEHFRAQAVAEREGLTIGQRVDPRVMAKLRGMG